MESQKSAVANGVAIIGMACRFPGADNVDDLWSLLCAGESMHTKIPSARFSSDNRWRLGGTHATFWGNFLENPATFDHQFFNMSSREAASMDPQQRLVLEVAYQAVESAGYFDQAPKPSSIGVYLGVGSVDYQANVASHPSTAFSALGTLRAFISGRINHHFGWTGPSITYDTACSSSAVAIHSACKAILSGECSSALAGGVNVITSPTLYEDLSRSGFLSPTGPCKTFDAAADGYCRGEGAGFIFLKGLSAALKDNDPILAVIASSAINQNDNSTPITVPDVFSQTSLYQKVLNIADLESSDVGVVEAHGTGTPVGDPIEFESICRAFGQGRSNELHVGSIKANIGHTEAASGVAAMIKAVLMIRHAVVPPQANFTELNPKITLPKSGKVQIPQRLKSWNGSSVCVNNYGAAGSNVALIVCQSPVRQDNRPENVEQNQKQPLIIRAKSETSLRNYCNAISRSLAERAPRNLRSQDIGFAMAQQANLSLPITFSALIERVDDLKAALRDVRPQSCQSTSHKKASRKSVVLCFGGQGKKLHGLHPKVFHESAIFRMYLKSCDAVCRSLGVRDVIPRVFDNEDIDDIVLLHCLLFSAQYACAMSWIACGLQVDTLVGHSFGQLTALCISGILSLEDTIHLIIDRASLIEKHWGHEKGVMLSIKADEDQIYELIRLAPIHNPDQSVEIACFNGPGAYVLVGPESSIRAVENAITQGNPSHQHRPIKHRRLDITHGFHSRLADDILPELAEAAQKVQYLKPQIAIEACSKETNWTASAAAIVRHTREPVFFSQAVQRIASRGPCVWIEAGNDTGVTSMVRNAISHTERAEHIFQSTALSSDACLDSVAEATVNLWTSGIHVQFWPYHRIERHRFSELRLPPYQFDQAHHWLDLQEGPNQQPPAQKPVQQSPLLSLVSFMRPQNEARSLVEFHFSVRSPEVQAYIAGHKVLGHSTCPASVYVHLVGQALVILAQKENPDCSASDQFSIGDLCMPSPLSMDHDPIVRLTMEARDEDPSRWSFSIGSHSAEDISQVSSHAEGVAYLKIHPPELRLKENLWSSHSMDSHGVDSVQGSFIYSIFSTVVDYAEMYKGIKAVSSEASIIRGRILLPDPRDSHRASTFVDPILIDNIIQVAGFYFNCLRSNPHADVFICSRLGRLRYWQGPKQSERVTWDVIVRVTQTKGKEAVCDIFARTAPESDANVSLSDVRFTAIPRDALARTLAGPKGRQPALMSHSTAKEVVKRYKEPDEAYVTNIGSTGRNEAKNEVDGGAFYRLQQCLSETIGIAAHDIREDSRLEDVGVDSLMTIEVLDEIEKAFKINIPLSEFEQMTDIGSLTRRIQSGTVQDLSKRQTHDVQKNSLRGPGPNGEREVIGQPEPIQKPDERQCGSTNGHTDSTLSPIKIEEHLETAQAAMKSIIEDTRLGGFTENVLPGQKDVVAMLIVKALKEIGLSGSAETIHNKGLESILPRHTKLLERLCHMYEKWHTDRLPISIDPNIATHAIQTQYFDKIKQLCGKFPQHRSELQLLESVGDRLAHCLCGKEDPLHLIFGVKETRDLLTDVYRSAPVFSAGTRLLLKFLSSFNATRPPEEPIRILEIGAGVGGTTASVIKLLEDEGRSFVYTFSDISSSLVAAARKTFGDNPSMRFMVLDVEASPDAPMIECQDIMISTNTIHATKSLADSCANVRRMLAPDGLLCLVELTRALEWYDLVFGLLDGWWLFEDGREHAIADVQFWDQSLHEAGFKEVYWTGGGGPDTDLIRLIVASAGVHSGKELPPEPQPAAVQMETVLFKYIEGIPLYADIYYPSQVKSTVSKQAIALLVHGGGHIMLSRKDIRPAQTQHLLDNSIIPISIDHRLCPELDLIEGPMTDVCHAFEWARTVLPNLKLQRPDIQPDVTKIAVIGWSTGGTLAMSVGWTAPARGLQPPEAILAFYCPTNYASEWYQEPHFPWRTSQADADKPYDLWDAVRERPLTGYNIPSTRTPGGWMSTQDPRARIPLHMNWTGNTVPILLGALSLKEKQRRAGDSSASVSLQPHDGRTRLPRPLASRIEAISPLAQIGKGNYRTPTYFLHGSEDDFIPWQETQGTYDALIASGVEAGISVVQGGGHMFEMLGVPKGDEKVWKAVLDAYQFLFERLRSS
ncbi:MAG: hypothetical protein Q9220_001997 [cf. Caloplaca sp. 1 TL-2023]